MIPLIGQASIVDWAVTAVIKCPCGQTLLMSGQPGRSSMRGCSCGKAYMFGGLPVLTPHGEVSFNLLQGSLGEPPPATS